MYHSLFFSLVLIAAPLLAQDGPTITLPAEVKGNPGAFITVRATTNGKTVKWKATSDLNLFPVELLKDTYTMIVTGPEGTHRIMAWTALGDTPSDAAICEIVIGTPAPPEPVTPPQPPEPAKGPRSLFLFRESADDTPALGGLLVKMQSGIVAKYMQDNGHSLVILDDDHKSPDAEKYLKEAGTLAKPVLVIVDKKSGAVVHKQTLSAATKTDELIALLQSKGG